MLTSLPARAKSIAWRWPTALAVASGYRGGAQSVDLAVRSHIINVHLHSADVHSSGRRVAIPRRQQGACGPLWTHSRNVGNVPGRSRSTAAEELWRGGPPSSMWQSWLG